MVTIRTAKHLLAVTAVLLPLDVFTFGQDIGWGATFVFGRYVNTVSGTQFQSPLWMLDQIGGFDAASQTGIYLWLVASMLAILTAALVVATWTLDVAFDRQGERVVGGAFIVAGLGFILSRAFIYDLLLVGSESGLRWFSIPIGAVYMVFVGIVYYRDLFDLGTTQTAETETTKT